MFLSSSASAGVGAEKKYDSSSKEMMNPEFVEHCRKLLLSTLLPEHPSFGFFTELQDTVSCQCCQKQSFFVRMVEKLKKKEKDVLATTSDESKISISHECYCVICFVDRFCNIHTFQNHDNSETHYIFKEKGSSSILYQSSSMIKRV
jgi:hypothetical protein